MLVFFKNKLFEYEGDWKGAAAEEAWELIDDWVIKVDSKGRVVCKGSEDSDIELVSSEDDSAGIEL